MIPVLAELLARRDIARAGFTSFLALSYGIDVPWFEHHVGRQLRLAGVRRFLLLADAPTLNETLPDDIADAPGAGNWYAVEAVRAVGAFHPKAYLLSGPRAARLYVGSGNLTQSGLGRNLEQFERWDATLGAGGLPQAFEAFGRYVYGLAGRYGLRSRHVRELLDAAFGEPVYAQPSVVSPSTTLGSPSEIRPLLAPPSAATSLTLTAPFFDAKGAETVAIARDLRASRFDVLVDQRMTNLTAVGRETIERAGGHFRVFDEPRRSHAKMLYAEGEGWALGVHGSANLSHAAWRGGNAELVVLRRQEESSAIRQMLAERATREVRPEEWATLVDHAEEAPGDAQPNVHPGLSIASARWIGAGAIEIVASTSPAPSCIVRLKDAETERMAVPSERDGTRLRISVPMEVERLAACAARLESNDGAGAWVVVHDGDELRFQARGQSTFDQRADAFLSGDRADGDATVEFLEFLAAMDEEQSGDAGSRGPRTAVSTTPPRPEWAWVKEEDFNAEPSLSDRSDGPDGRLVDGDAFAASRLLKRLLFGREGRRGSQDVDPRDDIEGTDLAAEAKQDEASGESRGRRADRPDLDLHELVARATGAFVARLRRTDHNETPERLLRSLLVLMAAVQESARSGYIRERALAEHLVGLVGAFLGWADAPFPAALDAISSEDRGDAWARSPFLIGSILAIYNACVVSAMVQDEPPSTPAFPEYRAALWARHVFRHAPSADPEAISALVGDRMPALRRFGVLWVADRWQFEGLVSFQEFAGAVSRDAQDIGSAEAALLGIRDRLLTGVVPSDQDDAVVGLGRDLRIAPGFIEDDRKRILFDGAFQAPDATAAAVRAFKSVSSPVLPLSALEAMLPNLSDSASRGFDLLRKMT